MDMEREGPGRGGGGTADAPQGRRDEVEGIDAERRQSSELFKKMGALEIF